MLSRRIDGDSRLDLSFATTELFGRKSVGTKRGPAGTQDLTQTRIFAGALESADCLARRGFIRLRRPECPPQSTAPPGFIGHLQPLAEVWAMKPSRIVRV